MVRITSVTAFVLAFAFGVQASHTCQCLFQDKSHCCASTSAYGGAEKCEDVCRNAKRNSDSAACNAGGAWSNVSAWNVQFREPCEVGSTDTS